MYFGPTVEQRWLFMDYFGKLFKLIASIQLIKIEIKKDNDKFCCLSY